VQREVIGWDLSRREVVLDKAVKHETLGSITHEKIVARIGIKPLTLQLPE
jgi:hypothetical protein